jgi:O-antigen ligase
MTQAASHALEAEDADGRLGPRTPIESLQRQVAYALALSMAFFAPWGEGAGSLFGYRLSRVFVALTVLFVLHWVVFVRKRFSGFPRRFNILMLFLTAHTLVFYLLFEPEALRFGYSGFREYFGAFRLEEEAGLVIARFFLFAAMGYALARHLGSLRRVRLFCVMYGLGMLGALAFTTGFRIVGMRGEVRFASGVFNPNSYALICCVALFLAAYVLASPGRAAWRRFSAVAVILVAGYGLLASGSRSGLLGAVVGLMVLTAFSPFRRGVGLWVPIVVLAVCALLVLFVPDRVLEDLSERLSIQRIQETGGARRLDIWDAYLREPERYALTGVGLNNSPNVAAERLGVPLAPHNLFLKVLVEFGLVGLVLFGAALWTHGRRLLAAKAFPLERAAMLALFACWLTNVLFHSFLQARETWIVLALTAAFFHAAGREEPHHPARGSREAARGEA